MNLGKPKPVDPKIYDSPLLKVEGEIIPTDPNAEKENLQSCQSEIEVEIVVPDDPPLQSCQMISSHDDAKQPRTKTISINRPKPKIKRIEKKGPKSVSVESKPRHAVKANNESPQEKETSKDANSKSKGRPKKDEATNKSAKTEKSVELNAQKSGKNSLIQRPDWCAKKEESAKKKLKKEDDEEPKTGKLKEKSLAGDLTQSSHC